MYKQAAGRVAAGGYINVMAFKADEPKSMLNSVTVVDIRSPKLYAMGWITGSIKVPLGKLSADFSAAKDTST